MSRPWPVPALVLTAGLGTRLRPLTDRLAKPALPVGNDALVTRILRQLATQGIEDAILNLHHLPASVARVVGDGAGTGVRVRYSWEQPRLLGSAGGIRHALPLVNCSTLLVVNGDTLCDLPIRSLVEAHHDADALVTLGLMPHPIPGAYGGVQVADDGRIEGFPGRHASVPTWHYPGVQVVEREVFADLPDQVPMESVREVYPRVMQAQPTRVRGQVFDATFRDIGTIAHYVATCRDLAGDSAGNTVGAGAAVAGSAVLADTVVWAGGSVGPDCHLTGCVVTDQAVVPAGTVATGRVFV